MYFLKYLNELKDAFEEKKKNGRWKLWIIDNEDDIDELSRNVYCVILRDILDKNKQNTIDLKFFYISTKIKNDTENFILDVVDFRKLSIEHLTDLQVSLMKCETNYGVTSDKSSLRVAEINFSIDISFLYNKKMEKEQTYQLMEKLYLNLNGVKTEN
ncbi:MAG: hypothetical protein ACRCXY_00810 [Fusobacteriaceae bacterium]